MQTNARPVFPSQVAYVRLLWVALLIQHIHGSPLPWWHCSMLKERSGWTFYLGRFEITADMGRDETCSPCCVAVLGWEVSIRRG